MGIDQADWGTPAPTEWCVHVAVSVVQIVPGHIRRAWEACEAYQRNRDHFWPDNRALTVPMGVGHVRSVQRLLGQLEDLGILERRQLDGNRRTLALRRRISDPITPAEWSQMEFQAEQRRAKVCKILDRG